MEICGKGQKDFARARNLLLSAKGEPGGKSNKPRPQVGEAAKRGVVGRKCVKPCALQGSIQSVGVIKNRDARCASLFFMDPAGIEPVSENPSVQPSSRTVCYLFSPSGTRTDTLTFRAALFCVTGSRTNHRCTCITIRRPYRGRDTPRQNG